MQRRHCAASPRPRLARVHEGRGCRAVSVPSGLGIKAQALSPLTPLRAIGRSQAGFHTSAAGAGRLQLRRRGALCALFASGRRRLLLAYTWSACAVHPQRGGPPMRHPILLMVACLTLIGSLPDPVAAHRPSDPPHQLYEVGDFTLESGQVHQGFRHLLRDARHAQHPEVERLPDGHGAVGPSRYSTPTTTSTRRGHMRLTTWA